MKNSVNGFTPAPIVGFSNGCNQLVRGFTLVEIMVCVIILTFIIAAIFAVLNMGDISWYSDMGTVDLQQQARQAMDGMVREIRQIDPDTAITIASGGSDISFYVTDDVTDPNNPVTYSIRYYLQDSQILRKNPAATGAPKILANDINSLTFCCLGASSCTDCSNSNILQIDLDAAKTVRNRPLSFTLTEQVRLRNE